MFEYFLGQIEENNLSICKMCPPFSFTGIMIVLNLKSIIIYGNLCNLSLVSAFHSVPIIMQNFAGNFSDSFVYKLKNETVNNFMD